MAILYININLLVLKIIAAHRQSYRISSHCYWPVKNFHSGKQEADLLGFDVTHLPEQNIVDRHIDFLSPPNGGGSVRSAFIGWSLG